MCFPYLGGVIELGVTELVALQFSKIASVTFVQSSFLLGNQIIDIAFHQFSFYNRLQKIGT